MTILRRLNQSENVMRNPFTSMAQRNPGDRRVLRTLLVFGLFLGLQLSTSFESHDHVSVADSIECVACHGVRIVPPTDQVAAPLEAEATIWVLVTPEENEVPSRGPDLDTRPSRGPPAA